MVVIFFRKALFIGYSLFEIGDLATVGAEKTGFWLFNFSGLTPKVEKNLNYNETLLNEQFTMV